MRTLLIFAIYWIAFAIAVFIFRRFLPQPKTKTTEPDRFARNFNFERLECLDIIASILLFLFLRLDCLTDHSMSEHLIACQNEENQVKLLIVRLSIYLHYLSLAT